MRTLCLNLCKWGFRNPLYSQIRWKSNKLHWAVALRKKWPTDHALQYFDDFYKPIFGKKWPSMRLGLLCPSKYCAVLNNFTKVGDQEELMIKLGAINVKEQYENVVAKYHTMGHEHTQDDDVHIITNVASPKEHEDKLLDEMEEEEDKLARMSGMYNQFVPSKKLLGVEEIKDESTYTQHYNPDAEVEYEIIKEPLLSFPEYLKVYVFDRKSLSSFPHPRRDKTMDLLGYYLMDGASILPALLLDVQPGNRVLDMCSAPGGKVLTLLQTLTPVSVVCNDVSRSRMIRLKNVFKDYVPKLDILDKDIIFTIENGAEIQEVSTYDKILVDAPCTNDRHSAVEDDNNWFSHSRIQERYKLPELQIALLVSAMNAVKPGGTIVYSTCSLSPIQNDGVVHMALSEVTQKTDMIFAVSDLTETMKPFLFMFRLHQGLRYGQMVIPFLPLNYGPMYFCKLTRRQ